MVALYVYFAPLQHLLKRFKSAKPGSAELPSHLKKLLFKLQESHRLLSTGFGSTAKQRLKEASDLLTFVATEPELLSESVALIDLALNVLVQFAALPYQTTIPDSELR
jgi:hypothetical protein